MKTLTTELARSPASRYEAARCAYASPICPRTCLAWGKCFVLYAVVLVQLSSVSIASSQPADSEQLAHFEWVRTIKLSDPNGVHPDSLLISEIKSLDVGPDGRMLVVDLLGGQALLFGPAGELLVLLDPSVCHPGFEVRPVNARFLGSESIFLNNAGPWGYRFTSDGRCLGSVDTDYAMVVHSGFQDVDEQGDLFGLYRFPDKQVIRHMDTSGKTVSEFVLPPSAYPIAIDRIGMGGLVVDDSHIFYAGSVEREILKLTRDGTVVARMSHRSRWFRDVRKDLPDPKTDGTQAFVTASGALFGNTTLIVDLFELSSETLLVQYSNGSRGSGYQVFTKEGVVVAQELGVRHRFLHGSNGLVYRVVQPDLDDAGQLPNPYIEVYEFVVP